MADSVCQCLGNFTQHHFYVVLSTSLKDTMNEISDIVNVNVFQYDVKNNVKTLAFGRDQFLDHLVIEKHIDAVLTIFGPSRWRPRVPHLCGFARSHLVLSDSPFLEDISLKEKFIYAIWKHYFKKSSNIFFTENSFISDRLPLVLGKKIQAFTVTNYYNQVFDQPEKWKRTCVLKQFDGITSLTVTGNYPHKNLQIMAEIVRIYQKRKIDFKVRFVLTLTREECPFVDDEIMEYFVFLGRIDITECPFLYKQSDIMFMPTLLECFTATYPEAMRMEVPIVTTDLGFAHSLCGNAACYYDALDANAAADAIIKVATDKSYAAQLIENGKKQLLSFDNYEQRAKKLIGILENIA